MTVTPQTETPTPVELVTLTVDGATVSVPKGTLVIRAAELVGVQIPRFCDHPLLDPVGACRQCIVEIEGQRKPMASCTVTVSEGMAVKTQLSSPVAEKAQRGTMELLLLNHPLDCPVCDKGGECPLQNQAMSNGQASSRFVDVKRTYPKPLAISSQVLLDRERCVLCARCTRFSQQVAGDPFIELYERGALEQVGIASDAPFASYFSGNTVQICPVGALTGASYRFRARPFDLVSTATTCEHCASGCSMRTDHRRGTVQRRLAGDDPQVNEEWNCDKGRWAFAYATQPERLTTPLVRGDDGALREASWTEALERAADGLAAAGSAGVLPGGRLSLEDAYGYAKFARVALGTHDVDHRARPSSAEEEAFLAHAVAGTGGHSTGLVTYADLETAGTVVLAGFEPEEESPIVFLRLRKAVRKSRLTVVTIAPMTTRGTTKLSATLLRTAPGGEAAALRDLAGTGLVEGAALAADGLRAGGVLLLGQRLAQVPGALSAALALAAATGCRIAWIPRRAGERGAVEAGTLPGLLPGGRPVADAAARAALASTWGLGDLPSAPGRDLPAMLSAAADGSLGALVVGGVSTDDLPDPRLAEEALDRAFVVSLEVSASAVTRRADVVLPVAPAVEKHGTFLDWEGRPRPFARALTTTALPDVRVLHLLAAEMGVALGLPDVDAARAELETVGRHDGVRAAAPTAPAAPVAAPVGGQAVLASWHHLLDDGALQVGEKHLAGTAPAAQALVGEALLVSLGVAAGDPVTVFTAAGAITLPVAVADLGDRVVWLPTYSAGSHVRRQLGATAGDVVSISAATIGAATIGAGTIGAATIGAGSTGTSEGGTA